MTKYNLIKYKAAIVRSEIIRFGLKDELVYYSRLLITDNEDSLKYYTHAHTHTKTQSIFFFKKKKEEEKEYLFFYLAE